MNPDSIVAHRITRDPNGQDIIRVGPIDPGNRYQLLIPSHLADDVCNHGNWLLYLSLERLLRPFHRVILHASAVIFEGKAYVFTAPSGTGKSTHADIWSREFDAEILNGDKVILSVEGGKVVAHGSPVAGSSGIYKNLSAPVAAIIQLKQSNRNCITDANNRAGYFALYSGLVKSHDDQTFNQTLLPYIETILRTVPVLTLSCRPERGAVECVLNHMDVRYRQ